MVSISLLKVDESMQKASVYILGIESSCDDTSAAVIQDERILSNIVANQEVHRLYGGVVPELASRSHQEHIVPVVQAALTQANIQKDQLSAIAFTRGPGLLGSLLVGTSFAKGLSLSLGIPLIDVHHMHAHIMAHWIEGSNSVPHGYPPQFPFLCLTVSGGHTQIVLVKEPLNFEVLGETIDDAAGEAFDKLAKMLGLSYPGGPQIDKLAASGNIHAFEFPKPHLPGYQFSFSGLKTSVLYFLQKKIKEDPNFIKNNLNDICASFQHSVVNILVETLDRAAKENGIKCIGVAGGVSANSYLRQRLIQLAEEKNYQLHIPKFEYCTDNAAMIAITGYYKFLKNDFVGHEVSATAKMKM
jgi:N6-L-threonylcarbamoyladenine synthase